MRQPVCGERVHGAQAQPCGRCCGVSQLVECGEDAFGGGERSFAVGGERDAGRGPDEESGAEVAFEPAQLVGDAGLDEAQPGGCGADAGGVGDGDEGLQ